MNEWINIYTNAWMNIQTNKPTFKYQQIYTITFLFIIVVKMQYLIILNFKWYMLHKLFLVVRRLNHTVRVFKMSISKIPFIYQYKT